MRTVKTLKTAEKPKKTGSTDCYVYMNLIFKIMCLLLFPFIVIL